MGKRKIKAKVTPERQGKGLAIYHDMAVYENFERAAGRIFESVKHAQAIRPGAPRYVYIDIQGHKNENGAFDHDAFELISDFALGFLSNYVSEIHTPLADIKFGKQDDNIPDILRIQYPEDGSDYGYDTAKLPLKPREAQPDQRKTRPPIQAIVDYLGMDEPACLVCWRKPVERAHVVPTSLGGSMDVRNFALLCKSHHAESPDVADAESFWAWVDYAELRDSPDKWLGAPEEHKRWLTEHGIKIGVGNREPTSFFSAVKRELKSIYSWADSDFKVADWQALMDEFHKVMDAATGKHFSIEKKISTHAWAYNVARGRIQGPEERIIPISRLTNDN
ncbi:HNH endonuclease [Saccharothrix sp. ST-888]|uniref:HNH endonuclease n=1 Tax=Saccharothrix sp. ST-888 TaxID=1427391 RepID=UPI000B2793F0|nr:HNH endonuclease [Saccharothrix sp. ST-888]